MTKELNYLENSPQSIKVGDTDTNIYLSLSINKLPQNLSLATSIKFKIADSSSNYIKSVDIDIPNNIDGIKGHLTIPLTSIVSDLPSGLYYFEVWVVANDNTDIYPDTDFKSFTINNNIEQGSSSYTTITLQDFETKFQALSDSANALITQAKTTDANSQASLTSANQALQLAQSTNDSISGKLTDINTAITSANTAVDSVNKSLANSEETINNKFAEVENTLDESISELLSQYAKSGDFTGDKGDTGNGISSIITTYGVSSDVNTQPTLWNTTIPSYSSDEGFYWIKVTISMTDGTSYSYVQNSNFEDTVAKTKQMQSDVNAIISEATTATQNTNDAIENANNIVATVKSDLAKGAFIGAKGDKGDQGIQGIQGIQGAKGDKGDTGSLENSSIGATNLSQNLRNTIYDSINASSTSNVSSGLFNKDGTITETRIWGFKPYFLKPNSILTYSTFGDSSNTNSLLVVLDLQSNILSSNTDFSGSYTASDYCIAIVNCKQYSTTASGLGGVSFNVEVDQSTILKFNNNTTEIPFVQSGSYVDLAYAYPSSTNTANALVSTTDFIKVIPNSLYYVSGYFGKGNGVAGYSDINSSPQFVFKNASVNQVTISDIVRIPLGINYVKISSRTSYPVYFDAIEGISSYFDFVSNKPVKLVEEVNKLDLIGVKGNNFPSGSPLDYSYIRQWGRRDFYNDSDSFGEVTLDLNTNMFDIKSNILNQVGNGNFTVSQSQGKVSFNSPESNGLTALRVKKYFPFSTERLVVGEIQGNATIGIIYGDLSLSNYLKVSMNSSQCVVSLIINNVVKQTSTFNITNPVNSILQIQNTGRALILFMFSSDFSIFTRVGRFDFGGNLDARVETYTTTWGTYVFAETENYTSNDMVSFNHFDSAIRSGANSVSIRFLTYEDGTFIQLGGWMYYLVEGTGESISDLFTQIVKINFSTGEVQSIGAIFEVRDDGTDEGILLGDDSINMVFDRNDGLWKGISCGMEYNDYISNSNDRPKLYFETSQNILNGGIVIVRNATQITGASGVTVGTSQSQYSEDFDFYWDSSANAWVVTGNTISNGLLLYSSPDLKSNYTTTSHITTVPTGVRDTGNQFVNFNGTIYITTGGTSNNLGLRDFSGNYLGSLNIDVPLSTSTAGPWCTLVPYLNGDLIEIYLMSFDRTNLTGGNYDHGGLYVWKAINSN